MATTPSEDTLPPRHVPRDRPRSASVVVETAAIEHYRATRVDPFPDDVIDEEMGDYAAGLRAWVAEGRDPGGYAATEGDRAIWLGDRLVALLRPVADGGEPEVVRFDHPEDDQRPRPTTKEERHVWELVKSCGAEEARDAILDRMYPHRVQCRPAGPLTLAQTIAGDLGEREAFDRIMLAGPYEAIRDAIDRLGTDAVRELRRMVDERRA